MFSYEVGSIVSYENFLGERVRVRVTDKSDDIKNGRPGFCGDVLIVVDGKLQTTKSDYGDYPKSAWGYDSQIVKVGS